MNKKFLNKVADRLVKETRIEFTKGSVLTPFLPFPLSSFPFLLLPFDLFFSEHCENVYALNNEEIDYVWKEYRNTIKDKIKNEQRISK
jgi:hypothetical protein